MPTSTAQQSTDTSKIYAMVSFGHKTKEGERNANFFVSSFTGIVDAARVLNPDIRIEWHGPNEWAAEPEVKAIRKLTARRIDGIIVTAAHKTALDQSIQEAIQAGVPVINFDADAPASERLAFVGTNNYNAGFLAGKTMAEWLQGQGDVAVSTIKEAEHLQERLKGFIDAIHQHAPESNVHVAYDSGAIGVDENGHQDFTEYRQSYIRMMTAHPEVRGLFTTYAAPGAGAAEAAAELGVQDTVQVLSFDVDENIIKLVESGKIRATVGQDSYLMGYIAMILTHAARHAPQRLSRQDHAWQIPTLQMFLDSHAGEIEVNTAAKLRNILTTLRDTPGLPMIDTGVSILGREELLDVVANNFETMQNSIITKIEALGQEIEIRKQAEHDLRTLNAELEQRVEERTLELATAYEEIQILNHQLQEENLRMCAELDVARRLQAMVLPPPTELEQIQGLDIVGYMKSADEVGGDYYDVLTSQEGLLHIGIGDVTGHGLESGVLMLMAQTTIRTLIDLGESDPVTFLNTLNRVLYQNIQRMHVDKSLTLSFVRYHDGQLKLIGQHEELLVVRHNGQLERVDTMNLGFPIGLEEDITPWIAEATVILESGDGVVLYTDGITEAENEQRKLYGVERLCDVISRNWQKPAEGIKQAVIDDVFRHIGQQQVFDDLTLVIMKQQ